MGLELAQWAVAELLTPGRAHSVVAHSARATQTHRGSCRTLSHPVARLTIGSVPVRRGAFCHKPCSTASTTPRMPST
eukprot:14334338-Alexandrium_andersonii.AAC.1